MPLESTHFAPFCSIFKILHTHTYTHTHTHIHTSFYTNQLSHQPAFTQTLFLHQALFCRNPLLHQPAFTQTCFYMKSLFNRPSFIPTSSCTNTLTHLHTHTYTLTHTHTSTQANFSTNQLLHRPPFAPTNSYKPPVFPAFTQSSFYTYLFPNQPNQLLDNPPTLRKALLHGTQLLRHPASTRHHLFGRPVRAECWRLARIYFSISFGDIMYIDVYCIHLPTRVHQDS